MTVLDLDALRQAPVQHDPCDYVVVPHFVRATTLERVNNDYPRITKPGNFEPEGLDYGPTFAAMLEELSSPSLKALFSEKFGLDLSPYTLQLTVRRYAEASDGNIHNDSKSKIVTVLIYFNKEWPQTEGRLRLMRDPSDIEKYDAEIAPVDGTLFAFCRNEHSYHGFHPFEGERRSLQMYWVKPKRPGKDEKTIGLKKRIKRFLKVRSR